MSVKLNLKKNPVSPKIVVAFPGFGLVGVIATEFLINHLSVERIGQHWFEKLPATVAIHEGSIMPPVSIYYDKKSNMVIIHSISPTTGLDWEAADLVLDVASQLKAHEIICLDGVGVAGEEAHQQSNNVFIHTTKVDDPKIKKLKTQPLKESIVIGIASALLLKSKLPVTAFFAETESNLPDSKAAANLIEILDDYIDLKVDYKPLLETAQKFEEKLKKYVLENKKIADDQEKKKLSYVG